MFRLKPDTLVELGAPDSIILRRARVERRYPRSGTSPSFLSLVDVDTNGFIHVTDEQIANYCREGAFRILVDPDHGVVCPPPSRLDLSPEQQAYCDRCMAYVDACNVAGSSRSRGVLQPRIEALARAREERAPGFTTVLGWITRYAALGAIYGAKCFYNPPNRGNRGHKLASDLVSQAIERGITSALAVAGTAKDALGMALAWVETEHPEAEVAADDWPDVRSVQARMAKRNRIQADSLTFGDGYAARKYRAVVERPRPLMPLDEVECDATAMDVIVVDEARGVEFGRPVFLSFLDRCTGHPLGIALGFEGPSYAHFISGARHAFFPKPDLSGSGLLPWEAYGRPRKLFVDNAMENIGRNIKLAASQLNMQVIEFRPANPWLKGAQERLLGIINKQVHKLPGTTKSNVEERKRYRDVIGKPIVTVSELVRFVEWWIRNEYVTEPHEGLGPLRTLKGVPRRLWRTKIESVYAVPLPEEYEFIVLAGDAADRAVTRKGVRWDNIRYQSPDLALILSHPDHRTGRPDPDRRGTKLHGTKFQVRRDPFNLGRIWVTNHLVPERQVIEVPACRPDYADGLTLHQHKVLEANHTAEELRNSEEPEELLMRKRAKVDYYVQFLIDERRNQGVQKKLARFLETGRRDYERSVVVANPVSAGLSRDPLDPRDPVGLPRQVARSKNTANLDRSRSDSMGDFSVADGLPVNVDRGAAITAAREARAARSGATPPRTEPRTSSKDQRRARRRNQGWGTGRADLESRDGVEATGSDEPPLSRTGPVGSPSSPAEGRGKATPAAVPTGAGANPGPGPADDATSPDRAEATHQMGVDGDGRLDAAERRRRRNAGGWG